MDAPVGQNADGSADTPARLLEMAFAFWRSALLLSADEIGLFAHVAARPCDAAALSAHLGLGLDEAAEYLEALAALGLLACRDGLYHTTPETDCFLDREKPTSICHTLAMARAAFHEASRMADQLRAGRAVSEPCRELGNRMWADIEAILGEPGLDCPS